MGIGLKLKFFITIFFILVLTAISISAIHFHFFRLERLRLIELNLEQNATLILNSDLTLTKKEFLQRGEDYIEDIIGDDKVNMLVSIYQDTGTLLYENDNAEIFDAPKVIDPKIHEWEDTEVRDYFIKYFTVKDKNQKRIIRVGMVLNQSLLRWKYLSQRVMIFAGILLGVVTLISYFLTNLLFRPVQELAQHINVMTQKLEAGETSDFESLLHLSVNRFNNDEFASLLKSITRLSQKISESHNITKKWSALMAHELKTPLTILKNRIDSLSLESGINPKKLQDVDEEMTRLEKIIVNFLEWATLESDPARPEIHAVSIRKRCEYILGNLREAFPQVELIFQYNPKEELKIFCHPIHFDQLLSNLITNAVKYGKGPVTVECYEDMMSVTDEGSGVPEEVIDRLGAPFNHFKQGNAQGSGLGLAWVGTICRKYGWIFLIEKNQPNKVKIFFPKQHEDL